MVYQEFKPQKYLTEYIDCFWFINGDNLIEKQELQFYADGCFELVFNLNKCRVVKLNNSSITMDINEGGLLGCFTQNINLDVQVNDCWVGVMFKPGSASLFFEVDACNLTNKYLGFDNLNNIFFSDLREQLNSSENIQNSLNLLNTFFLNLLQNNDCHVYSKLHYIINSLQKYSGVIPLACVADEVGISLRQLQRYFKTYIGLSPKQFCNVIRFNSLINDYNGFTESSCVVDAIYKYGFFDQSHFIKEFKYFTGSTPNNYSIAL